MHVNQTIAIMYRVFSFAIALTLLFFVLQGFIPETEEDNIIKRNEVIKQQLNTQPTDSFINLYRGEPKQIIDSLYSWVNRMNLFEANVQVYWLHQKLGKYFFQLHDSVLENKIYGEIASHYANEVDDSELLEAYQNYKSNLYNEKCAVFDFEEEITHPYLVFLQLPDTPVIFCTERYPKVQQDIIKRINDINIIDDKSINSPNKIFNDIMTKITDDEEKIKMQFLLIQKLISLRAEGNHFPMKYIRKSDSLLTHSPNFSNDRKAFWAIGLAKSCANINASIARGHDVPVFLSKAGEICFKDDPKKLNSTLFNIDILLINFWLMQPGYPHKVDAFNVHFNSYNTFKNNLTLVERSVYFSYIANINSMFCFQRLIDNYPVTSQHMIPVLSPLLTAQNIGNTDAGATLFSTLSNFLRIRGRYKEAIKFQKLYLNYIITTGKRKPMVAERVFENILTDYKNLNYSAKVLQWESMKAFQNKKKD